MSGVGARDTGYGFRDSGLGARRLAIDDCRLPIAGHREGLGDALQGENLFRYAGGKVHKQKMVFVIEVILAALVNNPHQIILGRSWIGNNPVNLAGNKRSLIVRIVNAKSEWFR
jgi:hypothetical protein